MPDKDLLAAVNQGIADADEDQRTARGAAKIAKTSGKLAKVAGNPLANFIYGEESEKKSKKRFEEGSKEMRALADDKSSPNHRVKAE